MAIAAICCRCAGAAQPTEYELKAAFVYNFAKFVEWPEDAFVSPAESLRIGILGNDPFGDALPAVIAGRSAAGRGIELRRYRRPADVSGCQILFIRPPEGELPRVLRALDPRGVLTVGEGEAFAREGGVIGLVMEENRVTFEVNLEAAERAHLTLSSKLLQLARRVGRWPVDAEKS